MTLYIIVSIFKTDRPIHFDSSVLQSWWLFSMRQENYIGALRPTRTTKPKLANMRRTASKREHATDAHGTHQVNRLQTVIRTLLTLLTLAGSKDAVVAQPPVPTTNETSVNFREQVLPILATNCFACHGADEEARQADLRLDLPADANASPDSSASRAIVAHQPDRSELMIRILSEDAELKMPPPDSGHSLQPAEIQLLKQWIEQGAAYETHWAFVRPALPSVPSVERSEWCRNPIDNFVAAKLEELTLAPAAHADPYALIRRVYLDLTGLPPTPEAADKFAADPSQDAFAAVVDQLLASPQFGEHWARMWLDLARYADTKGYEKDQPRTIWRYRDWVIEAFNKDMPFDQFTREQLAGDLLPEATTSQMLATAFHRNTMTNDEGGTDNEEFRIAAVKDRVDTTVQVWMGLTMGCAKCHSHKYDPITQREYYQFMAYFNQTEDEDRPDDSPKLPTPTPQQQQQLDSIQKQIADTQSQLDQLTASLPEQKVNWERTLAGQTTWKIVTPETAEASHGSTLTIQDDGSVLASGALPGTDVYQITLTENGPITALRLEALTHKSLPRKGPGRTRGDPNFVLSELTVERIDAEGQVLQTIPLSNAKADFSQTNWDVTKAIDGDAATGWAISPQQGQPHVAIFEFRSPLSIPQGQSLRIRLSQQYPANSLLLGCVRFSVTSEPFESLTPSFPLLAEIAGIPDSLRTDEQRQQLTEAFQKQNDQTAPLAKQRGVLKAQVDSIHQQIPLTPVMRDRNPERQRKNVIHVRGNFLQPGDEVQAALPQAFGEATDAGNRLAVANWILSPSNPLTSRVLANRLWARLFGRGIVETEEDFGIQGTVPTHPELLDWLAIQIQETHQWSIKKMLRTMVLSSAYQQSSHISPASRQRDPDNRWLSRSPRFRLSAEVVRDQSLFVSGLLTNKIGGPSVMPPQPEGIWRATYSSMKWESAENEDRYRRGLYTFLRRTSPYPSMITFDAGSGEVCQLRRIRTNTPLQALVTLNDPVFVEAAGALARTAIDQGEGTSIDHDLKATSDVIRKMFRRALVRNAEPQELDRLLLLYKDAQSSFSSGESATEFLQSARLKSQDDTQENINLAAFTVVASVILNLDEMLMKP
ncbi:MAG: PSD1 domain-containing protein [Planctomycetaceae bacterium]|nr:PSD1 domain-containing protein [Planctomycetaceae bacterium]